MERLTEQGKRWIVDVRAGAVAVYLEPQVNCFEDEMQGKMFYAEGQKIYTDNGDFDHWEVNQEDIKKAYQICNLLNHLADIEDKVECGELVDVVRCCECKHRTKHPRGFYTCEFDEAHEYNDNDYCSYGERSVENADD